MSTIQHTGTLIFPIQIHNAIDVRNTQVDQRTRALPMSETDIDPECGLPYWLCNMAIAAAMQETQISSDKRAAAKLATEYRKDINRLLIQTEINLLRGTAVGFESVLTTEFEKGGTAAINALRRMADHKEAQLTGDKNGKK